MKEIINMINLMTRIPAFRLFESVISVQIFHVTFSTEFSNYFSMFFTLLIIIIA